MQALLYLDMLFIFLVYLNIADSTILSLPLPINSDIYQRHILGDLPVPKFWLWHGGSAAIIRSAINSRNATA